MILYFLEKNMPISYKQLQNDRQYCATTGLTKMDFEELHGVFAPLYQPKKKSPFTQKKSVFNDPREALFFILYYLKTYPTQDVMAFQFGISNFNVSTYIAHIMPYLKAALAAKKALVNRMFKDQEAFDFAFEGVANLFIDGTELPIERAKDDEEQRKTFSGKKKFHTMIILLISDKFRRIFYLGKLYLGANVDFALFKLELANFNYKQIAVWVDLGFVGIEKFAPNAKINIPHKRKKNHGLTDAQKHENYEQSRIRVWAEHAIGGFKRYYILRNENRMKDPANNKFLDGAIELCAALWNFRRGFTVNVA